MPGVQKEGAAQASDEDRKHLDKKDQHNPLVDGLKTTAEKLAEHPQVAAWSDAALGRLKLTLWDQASPADKAAMLTFLGLNLGMGGAALASNPQLRQALSGVNIGKPLGWIPYSPVSGFTYTLSGVGGNGDTGDKGKRGENGKPGTGLSADFTLKPYLGLLQHRHPGFPLSGATFGLDAQAGGAGQGLALTGGRFGLDLFGGGLKAEGKTFKDLGPSAHPGYQVMVSADMLKLMPWLRKNF